MERILRRNLSQRKTEVCFTQEYGNTRNNNVLTDISITKAEQVQISKPDGIEVEMHTALNGIDIEKIRELNEIYRK